MFAKAPARSVSRSSGVGQNQQMGRAEETLLQCLSHAPRGVGVPPERLTTWRYAHWADARRVGNGGGVRSCEANARKIIAEGAPARPNDLACDPSNCP